jgi:hypothetical protein
MAIRLVAATAVALLVLAGPSAATPVEKTGGRTGTA